MTREEITNSRAYQVSKAALEYYNEHQQDNDIDLTDAFEDGAKWADKIMIDKAEKWLENFLEKTIQKPSINDGFTTDTIMCADYKRRILIRDVLYDFKKAMEL